jgi:hypothetical protein
MRLFAYFSVIAFLAVVAVTPSSVYAYGNDNNSSPSMPSAPVCTKEKPGTPVLFEPKKGKPGKITLQWSPVSNATTYTLAYGLSSRNYIYGAINIGNTTKFTVQSLRPGQKYYFSVLAVNDCMPSDYSNEWGVKVKEENNTVEFENFVSVGSQNVISNTIIPSTTPSTTPSVTPTATVSATPTMEATPEVTFETDKQPEEQTENPGFFGSIWNAIKSFFVGN